MSTQNVPGRRRDVPLRDVACPLGSSRTWQAFMSSRVRLDPPCSGTVGGTTRTTIVRALVERKGQDQPDLELERNEEEAGVSRVRRPDHD